MAGLWDVAGHRHLEPSGILRTCKPWALEARLRAGLELAVQLHRQQDSHLTAALRDHDGLLPLLHFREQRTGIAGQVADGVNRRDTNHDVCSDARSNMVLRM